MNDVRQVEILVVDDDELFVRQMQSQKIANNIHRAVDGVDALAFLRNWYAHQSDVHLIVLLDINMPRMGGLECLQEIRSDPLLRSTVVFVLTTSSHDEDVLQAYNLNGAGYLVKGDLGPAFVDGVLLLNSYWRIVELPRA